MAAEKGLNPEASAYIPRSLTSFLSILPTLSPITTPCCYFSSPPQPPPGGSYNFYTTFSSSSSSSFYAPLDLYTASYPQHPNSLPPPSPAAVEAPSSPTVLIKEQAAVGLVHEKVRRRTSKKGFGRSGFWRKVVGKREGYGYGGGDDDDRQQKAKFGNGKDRFLIHQKRVGSTSTTTRPHHKVLPLTSDEPKTTVMIKNVPNKYSRALLLKFLDQHCISENQRINEDNDACEEQIVSAFDFMYLPMDFRTGCNKGYAFVNFTEPRAVWRFYHAFHNKSWDFFQSPKIREIVCAKIQGKEALVHHFEKSTFRCDSDEFLPVCFSPARDGSGKWVKQHLVGERI